MTIREGGGFNYIVIPKSGCTTAQKSLGWHRQIQAPVAAQIKPVHFTVVRDPFRRAISCWWWACHPTAVSGVPMESRLAEPHVFDRFYNDPIGFIEYCTVEYDGIDFGVCWSQHRQLQRLIVEHACERVDFAVKIEEFWADKRISEFRTGDARVKVHNQSDAVPYWREACKDKPKFFDAVRAWGGRDFAEYGYQETPRKELL